jgi:hypothetical protein
MFTRNSTVEPVHVNFQKLSHDDEEEHHFITGTVHILCL